MFGNFRTVTLKINLKVKKVFILVVTKTMIARMPKSF